MTMCVIPVPVLGLQLGDVLLVPGVLDRHTLALAVQLLNRRLPLVPTFLRRDLVSLSSSATLLIVLRREIVVPLSLDAQVAGLTVFRGSSDILCDFHLESLLHELRMIISCCGRAGHRQRQGVVFCRSCCCGRNFLL